MTHITEHNPPGRPRAPVIRIPYPIPERDRLALMAAGKLAVQAMEQDKPALWSQRHANVEQVIATIVAKYGIEEQEQDK